MNTNYRYYVCTYHKWESIYTCIRAFIHTYINTSSTLLTFIWICVRCNSSLGEDVVIICIIFCITFCIVAFNFAAICIFTCGPTWKLLTDISKLHRTHIHTYIQECKWQAYILSIQVDAILTMEGQGVGVGVAAAAVVADTLTHSKHSLFHTAYTYSPHTYIHTYIHTYKQTYKQNVPLSRRVVTCSTWMQVPSPQARCP
jgi:hypothetical protein